MARKQEQEPARSEVTEVAPNVLRMELSIAMPGLGHVNCYALLDERGAAVVDPGLPGPDTRRDLRERLAQIGLRETDVHTVVITHSHPDHFGCANWLAASSGAEIVAFGNFGWGIGVGSTAHAEVSVDDLRAERDALTSAEPDEEADLSPMERWRMRRGRPSPWGGSPMGPSPRETESKVSELMLAEDVFPRISRPVKHGDVLRLADREWYVHHTPGHTSDHFCLHSPELEIFLSGDHVLPSITPHISGTGPEHDPLDRFMRALDDVARLENVGRILPAHGHPFDDLSGRTEEIKRHHRERLLRIKELGRELGAASVVSFSQRLFPERSWGMMAESETYAHLEHLRHAREAERYTEDGKLIYVVR